MKKHNVLKVVLISILLVAICSWIFPIQYFNSELIDNGMDQVGIVNLFSYPLTSLGYFSHILFYVLVCGGLYGVLYKIPAYRALLEKITKGFEGREWIFLTLIMVLVSVLTSFVGFSFGFIILFPFIISVILMMGYNKMVAATATVGSVIVGLIGNTFAGDTFTYIHSILNTPINGDIWFKILILVLSLGLLIFNVLKYANKTKSNSVIAENKKMIPAENKTEKKIISWPLMFLFDLFLIVMLFGVFPWATVFEDFKLFSDVTNYINEFELFGFPIFSKLFGTIQVFGEWTYSAGSVGAAALPFMVILETILLALIYGIKFDDFLDAIMDGMRKVIPVGAIMLLVYMILIISTYHPVQLVFVKWLLGLGEGLNVITMSLIAFISSFFNVEFLYVAQSTLPYVSSVITNSGVYPVIAIIFQSIYGLAMLVLPSSIILIGTLTYLDISYTKWLKHIWKLFVEILLVLLVIFMIMLAVI